MRLITGWIVYLLMGIFAPNLSATSIVDFLKYQGITYQNYGHEVGRELQDEDLEEELTKVKFKFVWDGIQPGKQPSYGPEEAYAAHLDIGTPIFTVKGYLPSFRLAARRKGRIILFEASRIPNATKGSDYFDLRNVAYIGINSEEDGVTELATIKDPEHVTDLVWHVMNAPAKGGLGTAGPRYFIAFHFRDGTASVRAFWIESGRLHSDIMLPPEFCEAIKKTIRASRDKQRSENL